MFGDAGYRDTEKLEEHQEREVDWYIAERSGKRKVMDPDSWGAETKKLKSQIRAKVEHPFRYMKQVFGYNKERYRGQKKNCSRFQVMAGVTNLLIAEKLIPT